METNPTPTQPDWRRILGEDIYSLLQEHQIRALQSVANTSYEAGKLDLLEGFIFDEPDRNKVIAIKRYAEEAVDTFRKRVEKAIEEELEIYMHEPGLIRLLEKVRSL